MALRDDKHVVMVTAPWSFTTKVCSTCGLTADDIAHTKGDRCCPKRLEFMGPCTICGAKAGEECTWVVDGVHHSFGQETGGLMHTTIHAYGMRWAKEVIYGQVG